MTQNTHKGITKEAIPTDQYSQIVNSQVFLFLLGSVVKAESWSIVQVESWSSQVLNPNRMTVEAIKTTS